jgi:hypothetical protein
MIGVGLSAPLQPEAELVGGLAESQFDRAIGQTLANVDPPFNTAEQSGCRGRVCVHSRLKNG